MRCRTSVGKYLLNLRPQLWPCGKHWSSCTIITSKQTAEESIRTKWHLIKLYSVSTVQTNHWLPPEGSKQKRARADVSYRWISIGSHHCRNSSDPPTGHLKARLGSPCWDTVCCWGPFTLICAGKLPTTTRVKGRQSGRKYSGLTGFLGIKKTEAHLVVRDLVLAVMWNLIKKEKVERQRGAERCLCRAVPTVNQGQRRKVWSTEGGLF